MRDIKESYKHMEHNRKVGEVEKSHIKISGNPH